MNSHSLKKVILAILMVTLALSMPLNAFAKFTDVKDDASYANSLNRLASLGIISADQKQFKPNDLLTREQFTRMIVVAAGLEDLAAAMKGPTDFPDISANAWSSGYINAAVSKNYITGTADGKFHPTQPITYAQLCTILVRALGYTTADLAGTWPYNYIAKAYDLGLTDGINLKNDAGVPRWAAAVMIDRMLDTDVKQLVPTGTATTFMESTGHFVKAVVYGDSSTMPSLENGQVSTDKGTYNNPSNIPLELGSENYIVEKNGNIQKAVSLSSVLKISVDQATGSRVNYRQGDVQKSMLLPDTLTYYYQGQKVDSKTVQGLLQKSTSIVFNYNTNKSTYAFAVVFDPVYSKPEIADNFVPSSGRLGSISFGSNPTVIRDGESIDISQIEKNDVVYQVTDIWGQNKYIQAVDKKVGGKITDVIPNNLSPRTLQIDGVNYDFSKDIDINEITNSYGGFTVDNNIVVYLGYDGKIVNIEGFGTQDNSDYAIVLNNGYSVSSDLNGTKKYVYTAKLLFSDGMISTYDVDSDAAQFKGRLVQYTFKDSDTVSLKMLSYNFPGETSINKSERLMGDSYVADNVKIFDVVYNDSSSEVTARLLKWSDLPEGTIPNGKVWYTSTTGVFNDINVIFTDDILNQRFKTGVVKSVSIVPSVKGMSYNYTILIDGKEYNYNQHNSDLTVGSVFKFKMNSAGIDSIMQSMYSPVSVTNVQAVDSRRIKIKDRIYYFNKNVSVYLKDANGAVLVKTLGDIDIARTYQKVSLYTDNSNDLNSKVNVILLVE